MERTVDGTDEPICRPAVETQTENRMWTWCGKERDELERAAWNIYMTICKTEPGGNLGYDAGSSHQALCDNLEGWDGVGGGRKVQERGDMYTCG